MYDYTGWIVQANAGRDKDGIFCVVGVDQEGRVLLLADGKRRRLSRPKRKKLGHVETLSDHLHMYQHPAIQKLREGIPPSNKELRRALAAFRAEHKEG